MTITIHYQTQIRRAVGTAAETIDLPPGSGLPELLERLADRHGDAFRRLVLVGGKAINGSILLFVGDTQVSPLDQSIPLNDGDVVTFLAPMAGG